MRAHISCLSGAMLILSTAAFASPSSANSQVLKSIAAEARQIQNHAAQFRKLTAESNATWQQYDREWNEIQPAVETLGMKIARLEQANSSLTSAQKQALEQSKAASQKIAWESRQLGKLVDQVPPDLSSPKLKMESGSLMREAQDVARAAQSGI